jgi:hypothetical protein
MAASELWGYVAGVIGLVVGVAGWLRTSRGDAATQAAWMGAVNAKLDHISAELSKLSGMSERVALIEASVKSAHKRMDDHLKGEI